MKLHTKILITIALAVIFFCLFGCTPPPCTPRPPQPLASGFGVTTQDYLERTYKIYNEQYFGNRLTKSPRIDMSESYAMATTMCHPDGTCSIQFNEKYIAAQRVADFTVLHEQCHIATWAMEFDSFGNQDEHGKLWRSCMLKLDAAGAFREIIIDHYTEGMK